MSTSNTRSCELQGDDLNQGVKSSRANIGPRFGLDESTVNAHIGQYDGLGPRYGMQPVPYHSSYLIDPNTGVTTAKLQPQSLIYNEKANASFQELRETIYAIYPIRLQQFDSQLSSATLTESGLTYFFITDNSNFVALQPRLLTFGYTGYLYFTDEFTWISRHGKNFNRGLIADNVYSASDANAEILNTVRCSASNTQRFLPATPPRYMKTAFSTISGIDNPYNNILGFANYQALTTAPNDWTFRGFSKEINYKNIQQNSAYYEVIVCGTQGTTLRELYKRFIYNSLAISTGSDATKYIAPDIALGFSTTNANITTAADTVISGTNAGAITQNTTFLFKNTNFKITSSYSVLFAAGPNPVGGIFQEWMHQRGSSSTTKPTSMQYFDPTEIYLQPQNQFTASYAIDGTVTPTGFSAFPAYVSGVGLSTNAALARNGTATSHYSLGTENSGLLRANTVYELAFSIYDKGTNVESNVCTPVRFQTGTEDFVRLSVYRQQTTGARPELCPVAQSVLSPKLTAGYPFVADNSVPPLLSHYQIRFYYRAVGTFEWLPTGEFDYAQFYFDPTIKTFWICEGAIASLPGGQPGGFNDYSPLPKDKWFDVAFFQGYAFWMSPSALTYSNKNEPFTYPVSNSVTISKGYCKGMLEHVYPGQSVQDSRLLVFTSEAIYAGRFTGNFQQMQVRVSPDTSATFDKPGSDFDITFWTSNIAFSSRSATVARGVLYYWGPTGIYRDTGNELPDKSFSLQMEPLINQLYDNTRTDEIHAIYNDKSKEVVWFYPPRPTGSQSLTKGIAYNTVDDAFFLYDFGAMNIDASQLIDVQMNRTNNTDICGQRVALYVRSQSGNAQEVVFFDDLCDSGDVKAEGVKMCTGVSVQGANRRLTSPNNVVLLPTSGTLTIANYNGYADVAESSGNPDGLYNIVGGNGVTYVDIAPINGSWTGFDFQIGAITDPGKCFPLAWEAEHGFTFNINSQYWAPFGMRFWGRWLYCYQSHKVNKLLRSSGQTFVTSWKSILGTGSVPRTITLSDNSRGNFQVHSQIPFTQQNADGQAISFTLTTTSGKFCGSRWYMQYLGYDVTEMTKNNFKVWEG
jgi:hypothetical protein